MVSTGAWGQSDVSEEALKAAFIFHFINFTEWNDSLSEVYVCIPEDHALKDVVQQTLKGKVVNQRRVVVVNNAPICHVMVSNEITPNEAELTIGPLSKGALLEFRLINNKLRFAANIEKIKQSKIKISSQLLKLAILEN
jgi:hypothetical protein